MAELDLASLVVSVRADVRDAATGIDNLNSKINSIGRTTEQAGADTARIQKEMTEGWVGLSAQLQAFNELSASIGKPLLNFFKGAVEGASDLQETVSKTNVVFGDLASEVLEWSESATTTMGLSRNSALSMASAFGDLATSMGLAKSQSQSMAMNLTQLAADLASFKNIDADQAFTALQGIFTGNAQALKGLGIVMNETTLEAYALSQGITTSYQSMSESEKVALRYQYVLAQTANAQGDFARTGGGFANATRTLKESVSELGSSLGEMLLPALETIIGAITGLVQFISDMPVGIKAIIVALGVAATAFTIIIPLIMKATAAFSALGAAMVATPVGWIAGAVAAIAGIAAIGSAFVSAEKKATENAEKIVKRTGEIKAELESIKGDYTVPFNINAIVQENGAETKIGDIAKKYEGVITDLQNDLAALSKEYKESGMTISVWSDTQGWKEGGDPNTVLKGASVDVVADADTLDTSGIGQDQKKIDGATLNATDLTQAIDASKKVVDGVVANATTMTDAITDKTIEGVVADAGTLKVAPPTDPIPVKATAEKIPFDYDPQKSFTEFEKYRQEKLSEIKIALNKGDTNTAIEAANALINDLQGIHITIDATDEGQFSQKILQWRDDAIKQLQNLTASISTITDGAVDYKALRGTLQTHINGALKETALYAEIASFTEGETAWSSFMSGWDAAEHAVNATIALSKNGNNAKQTEAAEKLLDKIQAIKANYNTTLNPVVSDEDLGKLKSYADQINIIAAGLPENWAHTFTGSLAEVSAALYEQTTGNKRSGSLLVDLQNVRDTINEGFGGETAWGQLLENIYAARDATQTWEAEMKEVSAHFNSILQDQVGIYQNELESRMDTITLGYIEAQDAGDEALMARLQKQYDFYQQKYEDTFGLASKEFQIDYKNKSLEENSQILRELDKDLKSLDGEGLTREVGNAAELLTKLSTGEQLEGLDIEQIDVDDLSKAITKEVSTLPTYSYRGLDEDGQNELTKLYSQFDDAFGKYQKEYEKLATVWGVHDLEAEIENYRAKLEDDPNNIAYMNYLANLEQRLETQNERIVKTLQERDVGKKLEELNEAIYQQEQLEPYRGILRDIAKWQGTETWNTREDFMTSYDALLSLIDNSTGETKALYEAMLPEMKEIKRNFDAKVIAQALLNGDKLTEETIASLDEGIRDTVQQLIDSEADLTDPEVLQAAILSLGSFLGQDLLQSGATDIPTYGGDHIESQEVYNGTTYKGAYTVNNKTYNLYGATVSGGALENATNAENAIDGYVASAIGG